MATYYDLNEYRRTKVDGEVRIEATGKSITVNIHYVMYVYQAGIGYDGGNDHNVFTVYLADGTSLISDWGSIDQMGLIRINEYQRITQEDGSRIRQYTGHGIRLVNDDYIATSFVEAGICYDEDGLNPLDCFRVTLKDGTRLFVDENGKSDIQNIS